MDVVKQRVVLGRERRSDASGAATPGRYAAVGSAYTAARAGVYLGPEAEEYEQSPLELNQ